MAFEIQAHRGGSSCYIENTLHAFQHAALLGVRVVELDVVVSADNQLVVSHDPWFCTTTLHSKADGQVAARFIIHDHPYVELRRLVSPAASAGKLSADCLNALQSLRMPLLHELIRDLDGWMLARNMEPMCYNIELKSWPESDGRFHPPPSVYAPLILEVIERMELAGRVRLQSFDSRLILAAWNRSPDICYGLLLETGEPVAPLLASLSGFCPSYVNPGHSGVDAACVALLHGLDIRIVPWTVNQPDDMIRLRDLGVDGIITDDPAVAMQLFSVS